MKKSYAIQLTYDVSDSEKAQAEKALICFDHLLDQLKLSKDHLNIIAVPFKNDSNISTDQIVKYRAALRRFRDKAVENFNGFKVTGFKCINLMQVFSSDTQTVKVMKSFINSIDGIEKQVNKTVSLFDKLESKSFVADIISYIEKTQKECDELENIVDERIKNHIYSNILGKTWVDGISNELQMKVEKKTPLLIDLHNERQEQLNNKFKR
ncbi:MAG: hypothetical protein AABY22_19775 [Nanoarchaeota archaeon]